MTIVFGNKEHGAEIARAIPRRFNPACDPVISNVSEDGKLLGGVIYDGYTVACIFIHQAGFSKKWLSKDMLWVAFDYPFNQLGCSKLCGTIPSTNEELLAFNTRLGFKVETRIRDAYPGGDMLILSMTRDECPWLKIKPGNLKGNL
jgi:RimJ/RimL family protein N-acetyltransferase